MIKLYEGGTAVEEIIQEIEQHFLYNGTDKEVVCSDLLYEIGNYKGDWHFNFKSIPESRVLMFIFNRHKITTKAPHGAFLFYRACSLADFIKPSRA